MRLGLTDHVEGPRSQSSADIYFEIEQHVKLADSSGVDYFWFSEHHNHIHFGHLPSPLLYAIYLAGKTHNIQLGTAIICLNLHNPISVAEEVAVADILSRGRLSIGFGSGSSPEEFQIFGKVVTDEESRHNQFREAVKLILEAWTGEVNHRDTGFITIDHSPLPEGSSGLKSRCWQAVNSVGSAQIAGELGMNVMFSHLRTREQYAEYREAYLQSGGSGMIAANRPVYVGETDEQAWSEAEPALRILWRRFHSEGKIAKVVSEPVEVRDLAAHPINFIVGGYQSVIQQITEMYNHVPFDVLNAEARWEGLTFDQTAATIVRLARDVMPAVNLELSK